MDGETNAGELLSKFNQIMESDPAIDEIGFVHPSQFVDLSEEASSSSSDRVGSVVCVEDGSAVFWNREHKLGISTDVLIPLYKEAKGALMGVIGQYKGYCSTSGVMRVASSVCLDSIGSEVMRHSRAVLLVSSDYGAAWNSLKMVLVKKQELSMLFDELQFSALVLSCAPKSEHAWCHRRWVIKIIAGKFSTLHEIVTKESEVVEKIAERSKMNSRVWYHRCWLVSYMTTEQSLHEVQKSKRWAGLHVADQSCFHYRRQLMLRIL